MKKNRWAEITQQQTKGNHEKEHKNGKKKKRGLTVKKREEAGFEKTQWKYMEYWLNTGNKQVERSNLVDKTMKSDASALYF